MILSKGLEKGNCSPCKLKDKDKKEFKLFTYINAETKYITSIKINNKVFKLGSDLEIYPDTFPPFFFVDLAGNTKHELYGLQAYAGASNISYHYFLKQNSEFHYLGHYPELRYIAEKDLFVSSFKGLEGGSKKILKLNASEKKFLNISGGK